MPLYLSLPSQIRDLVAASALGQLPKCHVACEGAALRVMLTLTYWDCHERRKRYFTAYCMRHFSFHSEHDVLYTPSRVTVTSCASNSFHSHEGYVSMGKRRPGS